MDDENIKYEVDEIEEGEICFSDDNYTPLQRPNTNLLDKSSITMDQQQQQHHPEQQQNQEIKMDGVVDDIEESGSDNASSSDIESDSDDVYACKNEKIKNKKRTKKRVKRTILRRVSKEPPDGIIKSTRKTTKFKKYDVWTASLQEESLTENMRHIGVDKYEDDRNVENYDFQWKYKDNRSRLGAFKRRISISHNSSDDLSDNVNLHKNKRSKINNFKTIKSRLDNCESTITTGCDSQNSPRHILDLSVNLESDNNEIARDIANKLFEEKDELMIRIVDILGKKIPIELFKETQRIEKDGGMMTMNGIRRRTPGGVFFFLVKHHCDISQEDKKLIFYSDLKDEKQNRKKESVTKRDKKVEELKKQLSLKEKESPALSKRNIDTIMCHLKPDTQHSTLSNPPPSPVTNSGGLESSPDYSEHAINHVGDITQDKSTIRVNDDNIVQIESYDVEYIDMNYSDMDLF